MYPSCLYRKEGIIINKKEMDDKKNKKSNPSGKSCATVKQKNKASDEKEKERENKRKER